MISYNCDNAYKDDYDGSCFYAISNNEYDEINNRNNNQ